MKSKLTFQQWLDINGFYYIKNNKNKPCFNSKLTKKLKLEYNKEYTSTKLSSFKCKLFSL